MNLHAHTSPSCAPGELPSGLDRLSFVWERGSKVFATEPEPVNPHTRACFWQQFLRQVSWQDSSPEAGRAHQEEQLAVLRQACSACPQCLKIVPVDIRRGKRCCFQGASGNEHQRGGRAQ